MVNLSVRKLFSLSFIVLVWISMLTACTVEADKPLSPRASLSTEDVKQKAEAFKSITATNVDAWNAKDLDAIRDILTDDIQFVDVSGSDDLKGITQVVTMARIFCAMFPELQRQATSHYIGVEEGIAIYDYWNWKLGAMEYTREEPFIYAFLLETRENLISSWRLFEGIDALEKHFISETASQEIQSVLLSYSSAWSSMDANTLADMYAKDAVRQDALFSESQQGRKAIKAFAESFFTWYPKVQWTPLEMFGERGFPDKPQAIGSSYAIEITDPSGETCQVLAVVLLHVLDGKIVQEDLYYDAESLIQCGWAE